MNNKNIEILQVETYPYLPRLNPVNRTRVFTKHFTNLPMYLESNKLAFFSWLVYQSRQDNSIKYSGELLNQYAQSIKFINEEYGSEVILYGSVPYLRKNFEYLVRNGYLFRTHERMVFLINPMFSYREEYVRASEYEEFVSVYQGIRLGTVKDVDSVVREWRERINKRIKDKK